MASNDNIVTIRDGRGRYLKGTPGGPGRPLGSRNRLSEDFLGDLQDDWRQHGKEILATMREKFPEIYFQSLLRLAVHNVELGQPGEFEQVRSKEDVLQKLEEHSGPAARKLFEEFLAEVEKLEGGEDEKRSVGPG